MGQWSLLHHVSSIPEVLEDGPPAFHTVHHLSGAAGRVALIDFGSLQTKRSQLRLEIKMTRSHEQSNRRSGGRRLPGSRSESVEAVEDHQRNDEAPEDHCRDEETSSLSRTHPRASANTGDPTRHKALAMTSYSTISDGSSPSKVSLHPLLLCIDDDEAVLDCVTSILEKHGYHTLPATCGRAGIQLFKENEVDLVILDHDMPNMDGCETAEELRHLNSKVPIIMSSGAPDIYARVGRLVDAYIPKGIAYSFLLSAISNLLPA